MTPAAAPFVLTPDWPGRPACVRALVTTRRGGVSPVPFDDGSGAGGFNLGVHVGDAPGCVAANRARLRALLPSEPVWLNQVHGVQVADAAHGQRGSGLPAAAGSEPAGAVTADASIASDPGTVCVVMTADCLPVLFADRAGRVVGAAHAGWRGLAAGVLEATVAAMRARGAADITAWLGPAIGPDRFEVGPEVRAAFLERAGDAAAHVQAAFRPHPDQAGHAGKYLADLFALARYVLGRVGVREVAGGHACTVSTPDQFYSYRRDGVTGRMASLIWLA